MRKIAIHQVRRQSGFSLIEILIAIVVLSIGLLGLAGLQFSALRGNSQSYERSQAYAMANEIADTMRANRISAATGAFNMDVDSAPPAATTDCTDTTVTCTPAEASTFALDNWFQRLTTILPGSNARITCSTAPCIAGSQHVVQVIWDENRTGLDSTAAIATACPASNAFDEDIHLSCVQVNLVP